MNGIERINFCFTKSKAFIAYLTAGDGGIQHTLEAAYALIDGGINILEIGMPFSDPIADGPVIQRAAVRALKAGTTLDDVLWLVEHIRKKSDIPLILFSYLNPILYALHSSFFQEARKTGIDGLLLVDSPIEESALFHEQCLMHNIAPIYVLAPPTPVNRIRYINNYGKGFLYYVCRHGTTGMRNELPQDFERKMKIIKSNVTLPVVVGFGISQQKIAKQILKYADGVVVGSLFVKALEDGIQFSELTKLAHNMNPLMEY